MRKLFQVWNRRISPSQADGQGMCLRTIPQGAGSLNTPLCPVISYPPPLSWVGPAILGWPRPSKDARPYQGTYVVTRSRPYLDASGMSFLAANRYPLTAYSNTWIWLILVNWRWSVNWRMSFFWASTSKIWAVAPRWPWPSQFMTRVLPLARRSTELTR